MSTSTSTSTERTADVDDHVVLLDGRGRPSGTAPKASVHDASTPLHLAFSCHVVDAAGRVLLTRRAAVKKTWPATWSNACCGHPRYDETLRQAVERRLWDELGLRPRRLDLAIPDFAYRAVMADGTAEHELCPVLVAEVDGEPALDTSEVDDVTWLGWDELRRRATRDPSSLSPWSVQQIGELADLAPSPLAWLDGRPGPAAGLDERVADRGRDDRTGRTGGIDDAVATSRRRVEARLAAFIAGLVERGGKRLRPAFVHWGHAAAGAGTDPDALDERVVAAGAAVELLHTFALIHDDVMDRSATRRGGPAVHVVLGDAAPGADPWHGPSAAILAGDLADVWADQLLDEATTSGPTAPAVRAAYHRLRSEVISGQYLDLRLAADAHPTVADARRVALLKSARYTVTRPLQLGAAIAGSTPALDAVLGAYGDAVGLAFQLRDDVLGVFGDPARTGKGRLDDLREGKRTLLAVRALALADDGQRAVLATALGDPSLDEDGAARAREVITATGALASVEALVAQQRVVARAAVAGLPPAVRPALTALADFAADRDA